MEIYIDMLLLLPESPRSIDLGLGDVRADSGGDQRAKLVKRKLYMSVCLLPLYRLLLVVNCLFDLARLSLSFCNTMHQSMSMLLFLVVATTAIAPY